MWDRRTGKERTSCRSGAQGHGPKCSKTVRRALAAPPRCAAVERQFGNRTAYSDANLLHPEQIRWAEHSVIENAYCKSCCGAKGCKAAAVREDCCCALPQWDWTGPGGVNPSFFSRSAHRSHDTSACSSPPGREGGASCSPPRHFRCP